MGHESSIGQRGRLAAGVSGFCGVLGTRLVQARPYDPETKGVVERANSYLGTSILPGRTLSSPQDFNAQVTDWLTRVANPRRHVGTGLVPANALGVDRQATATLPPVAPTTGTTVSTRLGRDSRNQPVTQSPA